jgi:phospholipase/carboxylesterase
MAYALAFGRGRPAPAGVLAMSGFIPTVEDFQLDLESRAGFPVAIAHGRHDPVIGVEWGWRAKERLEGAGLSVTYREGPVAHQVDPAALPDLAAWLRETVADSG